MPPESRILSMIEQVDRRPSMRIFCIMGSRELDLIRAKADCARECLPFIERTKESLRFVYLLLHYGVGIYGKAVAIWTDDGGGRYRRYVYATGPIDLDLDEEMEWFRNRGYPVSSYDSMFKVMEAHPELAKQV